MTQTIVWTVLPNGATGEPTSRRLRLSVFVSPRLTSVFAQISRTVGCDAIVWYMSGWVKPGSSPSLCPQRR